MGRDVRGMVLPGAGLVRQEHHNCASHLGKADQAHGQRSLDQDLYRGPQEDLDKNGDPDNHAAVLHHYSVKVQEVYVGKHLVEVQVLAQ